MEYCFVNINFSVSFIRSLILVIWYHRIISCGNSHGNWNVSCGGGGGNRHDCSRHSNTRGGCGCGDHRDDGSSHSCIGGGNDVVFVEGAVIVRCGPSLASFMPPSPLLCRGVGCNCKM